MSLLGATDVAGYAITIQLGDDDGTFSVPV